MRAHRPARAAGPSPAFQHGADGGQQRFERGRLVFEQRADVDAGGRAGPPQRGDSADLREREPELPALGDEREDVEKLGRIDPIAGRRAPRRREDAPCFVEPERLAADSTAARHLADQQTLGSHAGRIDLAAWGKVKPLPTAAHALGGDA